MQEVTLLSAYTSDTQYAYVRYSLSIIYTLGNSCTMDIESVLDLYYEGSSIHTTAHDTHQIQHPRVQPVACTLNTY